jgi:polar amino acid transport system substrate-binding protein
MEIARLIASRLGVKLVVKPCSFDGLFSALRSRRGDIIMAACTLTASNRDSYPHSQPYADAYQEVLVLKDRDDIKGFRDLAGKRVGVPVGTTSERYLDRAVRVGLLKGTKTKVHSYENNDMLVYSLMDKYVDAVLLDSSAAEDYLGRDSSGLKVLPERLTGEGEEKERYVFFYADGMSKEVIDLIDSIIAEIKEDGTLDGFYAKHSVAGAGETVGEVTKSE